MTASYRRKVYPAGQNHFCNCQRKPRTKGLEGATIGVRCGIVFSLCNCFKTENLKTRKLATV
jgi:hypothetical protein